MKIPLVSNLFRKKKEDDHFLALDIGSAEVKAVIFRAPTEFEGSKFIGLGKQRQGATSMRLGKIQDLDAVIETANLAIEEAQLHAGRTADQVIVGLSGGAMYSRGLRVRTHRAEPDTILTEEEFDGLAEQIEEKTLNKAQEELENRYNTELQRVETSFTAYQIDGAKVRTPLGLSGGDLEVAVLHYFIEQDDLRNVESLASELGLEIVSLVDTAVNLSASKIEQYFDSIVIDIGGDVSQVIVVRSGKVVATELLFWGGGDITQQIAHDFGVTIDEADSLKVDYTLGHLDYERAQDIQTSIEKSLSWWVEGVAVALKEANVKELPSVMLLGGQSRHLSEVKTLLASYPWDKKHNFAGFPKIESLGGKYPGLHALTKIEV